MECQNELRSNYLALKNQSEECKCPNNMKCTVDVNRISAALDAYYVKFQNLSNEKNKYETLNNDISKAFSEGAIANHQKKFQNENISLFTPDTKAVDKLESQKEIENKIEGQLRLSNDVAEKNNSSEEIFSDCNSNISLEPLILEHSKPHCHMVAEESVIRPFRCSECGMAFKRNLHLKRHFMVSHTSKKNFSCSICGKSFSRKDYLDKHAATHEKKKFKLQLLQQGIIVRTKMNVKSTK